jgi:hypothetical protein
VVAAALAAVTLLSVQGCAPAPAAEASTQAAHDLTIAEARTAYQAYVSASNAAAAADDQVAGLAMVQDEQWSIVKGQYTALTTIGIPVPQYSYGTPTFYVPGLSSFPYWFVVDVARKPAAGGAAVTTLLLFERGGPQQPWMLDGSAALTAPLPALATDGDGYYVDVYNDDPDTMLQPDLLGASQAAVVDQGPANPAAAVVAAGPETTGLYAAQSAEEEADKARGVQYSWLLEGTSFPEYQLRTADGGALVFYGMYLDTEAEHPNAAVGSPIPVPASIRPLLAQPDEVGYHEVYINYAYQYAAVDPPSTAHGAKTKIVAVGGGPSYAHAY